MGQVAPRGTDAPWPTSSPTMLADWVAVTLPVQATECSEEVAFASPEEQVQASYYQGWGARPALALHPVLAWRAPVRSGPWTPGYWLQLDLAAVLRVAEVSHNSFFW